MCSIIGTFAIGIIGFGWLLVRGRSRVPSPPARMTAFMCCTSTRRSGRPSFTQRLAAPPGTYSHAAKYPSDDPADREAPAASRTQSVCERRRPRRRAGTSAARTSARACPPCRPTRRRCGARPRRRARPSPPRSSTSRSDDDPQHDVDRRSRVFVEQRDRRRDEQDAVGRRDRGSCRARCPGRSAGRCSRRPSRSRRAPRAARPRRDRLPDRASRAARGRPGRSSSRTIEITFGIVQDRANGRRTTVRAAAYGLQAGGAALGAGIGGGPVAGIAGARSRARCRDRGGSPARRRCRGRGARSVVDPVAGSKWSSIATRPVSGSIVKRGALIACCGSSPSTSMRVISCVCVCAWPCPPSVPNTSHGRAVAAERHRGDERVQRHLAAARCRSGARRRARTPSRGCAG